MRGFTRVLGIVAVACALAGAYNVYADNSALQNIARQKACQGGPSTCRARLARLSRSPFKQAFVFSTGGAEVEVACTRHLLLVGTYQCVRPPPAGATDQATTPGSGPVN